MNAWTLTIPAPAKWLNANSRTDRRRQTPDRQAWRDAAHVYARQAKLPYLQRVHILAELRFTDRRRRDPHNYYPTIKAVVDGLVDYGLLPDDSSPYLVGPDIRLGDPVHNGAYSPPGRLVLTIRCWCGDPPLGHRKKADGTWECIRLGCHCATGYLPNGEPQPPAPAGREGENR